MAAFVHKNIFLSVETVDLSDHVTRATLTIDQEKIDVTNLGSATTTRIFTPGLINWSLEVEFQQDYAASKVDATLWPLLGSAAVSIVFRPTTAARGATNPEFTGECMLESYPAISAQVGSLSMSTAKFAATGILARGV